MKQGFDKKNLISKVLTEIDSGKSKDEILMIHSKEKKEIKEIFNILDKLNSAKAKIRPNKSNFKSLIKREAVKSKKSKNVNLLKPLIDAISFKNSNPAYIIPIFAVIAFGVYVFINNGSVFNDQTNEELAKQIDAHNKNNTEEIYTSPTQNAAEQKIKEDQETLDELEKLSIDENQFRSALENSNNKELISSLGEDLSYINSISEELPEEISNNQEVDEKVEKIINDLDL